MLTSMRIYSAHDDSGCGYYRLVVPLTELGKKDGFDVTLVPQKEHKGFDPDSYDLLVGQRLGTYDGLGAWRRYRRAHNRLVYENDDDVFSIRPDNPAYSKYTDLSTRSALAAYMTYSDLVTVTNDHLADEFELHAPRRPTVLPNFIRDFVLDLPRELPLGRFRLGYMGSVTHRSDLELAADSVRTFIRQNDDWDLRLVGVDYRWLFKLPSDRVSVTPWVNVLTDELGFYQSLDCDVAIAPLQDTKFNRSKSYIKALEYNARGIPVIASNVGPYKDYIIDGWNGFLVKHPHEWSKYLNMLATDHELRETMSTRSRIHAEYYTIENNWQMWADAYEELFK